MPRPAGRSGCVRTRGISCPASSSAVSARAAKSGVPAKTRRRKSLGALAELLGEARADALLLELRETLYEDLALQVIHLVLDAHREQPPRSEREKIAVPVVRAHLNAFGALERLVDPRYRQATFLDVG